MKTKAIIITIFALLSSYGSSAQSASPFVISSSGGYFSNGICSVSESIGEMTMINTLSMSNIILTEGFQQPFEIDVPTVVPSGIISIEAFSVYPNPSNGICFIKHDCRSDGEMTVHVVDIYGKNLFLERFPVTTVNPVPQLNLIYLPVGLYVLILNGSINNERITPVFLKLQIIK